MFSGWFTGKPSKSSSPSYSFSSYLSPKAWIAQHLSQALATYFVVDPSLVEANLVSGTKILLRDVCLKPQLFDGGGGEPAQAWLVGRVDEIEFAWTWGGASDGSTSYVSDTRLVISGAKFRLLVASKQRDGKANAAAAAPLAEKEEEKAGEDAVRESTEEVQNERAASRIEQIVQQIIDHLTLTVADVELTVEEMEAHTDPVCGYQGPPDDGNNSGRVVLELRSLQLQSLGRQKIDGDACVCSGEDQLPAPPLSQRLSLGSLRAYVLAGVSRGGSGGGVECGSVLPLLDPFGYAASVRRVSGRRFLSFDQGLEITGETLMENPSFQYQVVIHAGRQQLAVLNPILQRLLPLNRDGDRERPTRVAAGASEASPPRVDDAAEVAPRLADSNHGSMSRDSNNVIDAVTAPTPGCGQSAAAPTSTKGAESTVMTLPLPGLTVILPNESKVSVPSCIVQYRWDGSTCCISGRQGVLTNNRPFFELSDGAMWCIDFIHSSFVLTTAAAATQDASEVRPGDTEEVFVDAVSEGVVEEGPSRGAAKTAPLPLARVCWDEIEMKRLFLGFMELEQATQAVVEQSWENWLSTPETGEAVSSADPTLTPPSPWSVLIHGSISFLILGQHKERMEATLQPTSLAFDFSFTRQIPLEEFHTEGVIFGPTSFGDGVIRIPPLTLSPSRDEVHCRGTIEVSLNSMQLTRDIQTFVNRLTDIETSSTTVLSKPKDTDKRALLPLGLKVQCLDISLATPRPMSILAKRIHLGHEIKGCCEEFHCFEESQGACCLAGGITFSFAPDSMRIRVQEFQSLCIPRTLVLEKPMKGLELAFTDGKLDVDFSSSVHVKVHGLVAQSSANSSHIDTGNILPFPLNIQGKELYLSIPSISERSDSASIICQLLNVDFQLEQTTNGLHKIASNETIGVHIESEKKDWLEAKLHPFKASLSSALELEELNCSGMQIGPFSGGAVSLIVPSFLKASESTEICIVSPINGSIHSFDDVDHFKQFLNELTPHHAEGSMDCRQDFLLPLGLRVQRLNISVAAPNPILVSFEGIRLSNSLEGNCERVQYAEGNESCSGSASGVSFSTDSTKMQLEVKRLCSLSVPGNLLLEKPMEGLVLTFEDGILDVDLCSPLHIRLDESKSELSHSKSTDTGSVISFPVRVRGRDVSLYAEGRSGGSSTCRLLNTDFQLEQSQLPRSTYKIVNNGTFSICVSSESGNWLSAQVSPFMASLSSDLELNQLNGSGLKVGPFSGGTLSLSVPSFKMLPETMELLVNEPIEGLIDSLDVLQHVQSLLKDLIPQAQGSVRSTHGDPLKAPGGEKRFSAKKINLNVSDSRALFHLTDIAISDMSGTIVKGRVVDTGAHLQVQKLQLQSTEEATSRLSISLLPLAMHLLVVGDVLSLDLMEPIAVRFESSDDEWLKARITDVSSTYDLLSGQYSVICRAFSIGPSSYGPVRSEIRSVTFESQSNKLTVHEPLKVSLPSVAAAEFIQSFSGPYLEFLQGLKQSSDASLTVEIPELDISCEEVKAKALAASLAYENSAISCSRLAIQAGGKSVALAGIEATSHPDVNVSVDWIDTLYFPGICYLVKPVERTTITFSPNDGLVVMVPPVSVAMLENDLDGTSGSSARFNSGIPFPVKVALAELTLKEVDGLTTTSIRNSSVHLKPAVVDPFSSDQAPRGVSFALTLGKLENSLLRCTDTSISGTVLDLGEMGTINNLVFNPNSVSITAGFSSVEWSRMFSKKGEETESKVICLPCARVEEFSASIEYAGKVVSTKSALQVPQFIGGPTTTSKDITQYITSSVLGEIPSFFGNATLLGENVGEMTAKNVGTAVLASTVAGSCSGGVVGLVAFDSVKGAVSSGKKARGATDDSKYRFGDVTRGTIRALNQTAKTGAEIRSGDKDSSYSFGDFSKGAAKSVGGYARGNKSRLGSAGGSGVGAVIGTAIAGPIGFVAGSYIGSRVGGKAFEDKEAPSQDSYSPSSSTAQVNACNLLGASGPSAQKPSQQPVATAPGSTTDPFATPDTASHAGRDVITGATDPFAPRPSHQQATTAPVPSTDPFATHVPAPHLGSGVYAVSIDPFAPGPSQTHTATTPAPTMDPFATPVQAPSFSPTSRAPDLLGVSIDPFAPGPSQTHTATTPAPPMDPFATPVQAPSFSSAGVAPDLLGGFSDSGQTLPKNPRPADFAQAGSQGVRHYEPHSNSTPSFQSHPANRLPEYSAQAPQPIHNSHAHDKVPGIMDTTTYKAPSARGYASPNQAKQPHQNQHQQKQQGYHFGDITRSVVAKGKQKAGRSEQDGYKFGDFTRGLFGK